MSKRVAVYARVSTTRQAESDISIPDQLARVRRYCQDRGWFVVQEFIDPGASARDDKRPEFQHLMAMACTDPSPFEVVLVHSQSRFFRDTAGFVMSKRKLSRHGVSLVSMTQDFGEGPSADFAETIIAAADAFNSAETAKHVSRTMLENARQGFWNGAPPPFGYRTVAVEKRGQRIKKHLVLDDHEAAIVRQVFDLFLKGDGNGPMGVKDIVSWLNANGLKNRNGNLFYTSAVYAMLTRSAYAGVHYYNTHDSRTRKPRPKEEWIAVPVPALTSAETFTRVQDTLRERAPTVTPPRITTSEVLLSGLLRCAHCGRPLMLRTGTGSKGRIYRYYACSGHALKGTAVCTAPVAVPEARLDQAVLPALTDQLLTPERLTALLRAACNRRRQRAVSGRERKGALTREKKDLEGQIDRLLSAVAQNVIPNLADVRAKIDSLSARRDECCRLLAQIDADQPTFRQVLSNGQATRIAATLKQRLLQAPTALQRSYVRGLVAKIVVARDKAVLTGLPEAVASAVSEPDTFGNVRTFEREWCTR